MMVDKGYWSPWTIICTMTRTGAEMLEDITQTAWNAFTVEGSIWRSAQGFQHCDHVL